jgi:O-antigen/teichoic acid export membrane protein
VTTAEPKTSRLARTFAALVGSQAIAKVLRIAYLFVVARLLPPEQVGLYVYGVAFYLGLSVFTGFGQGPRLATEIPRLRSSAGPLLARSLGLVSLSTFVIISGAAAYLGWVERRGEVREVALIFLVALAGRTVVSWVRECFVAFEDVGWLPRYEIIFRGGEAAAGITALFLGAGLTTLCALHAAAWTVEAGACIARLRRRVGPELHPRDSLRGLAGHAAGSLVFLLSFSFLQLFPQIGTVVINNLQGDTALVGQFGIAMQLLMTALVIPAMLGSALLPAIGRVLSQEKAHEIDALAALIKLTLLGSIGFAIVAELLAPWALATAVGPDYRRTGEIFAQLSWGLGPLAAAMILSTALNGLDGRWLAAALATTMVVVHVGLMLALAPRGPLLAATASLIVGAWIGAVMGLVGLSARLRAQGHTWWLRTLVPIAGAGVAVHTGWLPAPVNILVAVATLALLTWILNLFTTSEVDFVLTRVGLARRKTSP